MLAVIQYKLGIKFNDQNKNIFFLLVKGLLLFSPYIILIFYAFKKMSSFQVETISDNYYIEARNKATYVVLLGFILMVLVPWFTDLIIPTST